MTPVTLDLCNGTHHPTFVEDPDILQRVADGYLTAHTWRIDVRGEGVHSDDGGCVSKSGDRLRGCCEGNVSDNDPRSRTMSDPTPCLSG